MILCASNKKLCYFPSYLEYRPVSILDKYKRSQYFCLFLNPIKWHPGEEIYNFLSFGDSWDGIGTVVSGYWGSSITISTMISKTVSSISISWGSSVGGSSYWGSGVGSYGYWGSYGNWGSYWFDVYVWFSWDFSMYVWFSSDFFMDVWFSSDFFMDVWFSSDFEVE